MRDSKSCQAQKTENPCVGSSILSLATIFGNKRAVRPWTKGKYLPAASRIAESGTKWLYRVDGCPLTRSEDAHFAARHEVRLTSEG